MSIFQSFSRSNTIIGDITSDKYGFRGAGLLKLSELELPIAPGFILSSDTFKTHASITDLRGLFKKAIACIESQTDKIFAPHGNPLMLKFVPSPSMQLESHKSLHNIGLNDNTVEKFAALCGNEEAYGEYSHLLKGYALNFAKVASSKIEEVDKKANGNNQLACKLLLKSVVPDFPQDPIDLLISIVEIYHNSYYSDPLNEDIPSTYFIQMMTYGNFGEDSYSGEFYTREINSGKQKLEGFFDKNVMFADKRISRDIYEIGEEYLSQFEVMARIVENHFLALKLIRFTIEKGRLWLVSIFSVESTSTKAEIRTLLDLNASKTVSAEYVIKNIVPNQLNDLLHNKIDHTSATGKPKYEGGIAGSPGACIGKICLSTRTLIESYKDSIVNEEDTRFILVMPSTYAGDVQAIEIGQGVISSEGGYASHAPVVARSLGKPALVIPDIKFNTNSIEIEGVKIKEGDYISMDINNYSTPTVYFDEVDIIPPDMEKNEIFDLMKLLGGYVGNFTVRANADHAKDAKIAKTLGAKGIGLCRTEHMFFAEERINIFRELLLEFPNETEIANNVLDELKAFQIKDFTDLFECANDEPVTIRLLDAPLHEFIPLNLDQREIFEESYRNRGGKLNSLDLKTKFDRLKEVNPMLGHRGCRVAVSFFAIYKMQILSVFEAALASYKKGITVHPEIMVPMVMDEEELKFIYYGKDIQEDKVEGFIGLEEHFKKLHNLNKIPFSYKIGTMVELPAAALSADSLSKHAEFLSIGTNDLTQTTHGLSRDDINSFLPAYTKFDILKSNPFQKLTEQVKSLIIYAVQSSRLVRPNIKVGLCGEHGSDQENIRFCMENNLDYVSCSPYSVPLALLSIARFNIDNKLV